MKDDGMPIGSGPSLTNASDDRLADLIEGAARRVVLVAAGLSEEIADALSRALGRLGRDAVCIILDVDPEVCRLGYGALEGLERVREAAAAHGALVCHQPGLRIGLLIVDDCTLVFSPTPLLIEAGSETSEHPNAIELGVPPPAVIRDLGLGARGMSDRRIGLDPLDPQRMAAVRRDLNATPPLRFDLARQVRVFTSHFQFVELQMTGCHLSRRRIAIPPKLMGLARTPEVERRFQATFALIEKTKLEVQDGGRRINEDFLANRKRDILRRFLIPLSGYGSVVLRSSKDRLIEAVDELRSDLERFSQGVKVQLEAIVNQARGSVRDALLPGVERNPPDACMKIYGPRPAPAQLRAWLDAELERCFDSASDLIGDMKVSLIFKDVAYESLIDPKFVSLAREAMPGLETLHLEFDAAASSASASSARDGHPR